MSNSTPKRGLSGLISKFLRTGSEGSSSSSSAEAEELDETPDVLERGDEQEISPIAMMNENSPEAWLGQFLLQLELRTSRGTLAGAAADAELRGRLVSIREGSGRSAPLRLLDAEYAEELRAGDWSAWWRAQDDVASYCYATLALALLGEKSTVSDLGEMYTQRANSRIHKDAHYVLCHMLGKPWPSYRVTPSDMQRLATGSR